MLENANENHWSLPVQWNPDGPEIPESAFSFACRNIQNQTHVSSALFTSFAHESVK